MNIEELTIKRAREIAALVGAQAQPKAPHPFLGKRVLIRTYSAGVHIGTLKSLDGMEAHLTDSLRLWKWEDGGLSLSAVATNGIRKGRLNRCSEIFLTNAIEIIPTTAVADSSFEAWVEDQK